MAFDLLGKFYSLDGENIDTEFESLTVNIPEAQMNKIHHIQISLKSH